MSTPKVITTLPNPDDFWGNVAITHPNECWEWKGYVRPDGYGQFYCAGNYYVSHRIAFALTNHVPDPHEVICHTCDNRKCCNPTHLYSGTPATNAKDRVDRGRAPRGEDSWPRKYPEKVRRGEQCPQTPLTADLVREIRTRYAQGGITQLTLSEQYGVSLSSMNSLIHRKTWQHTDDIQPPADTRRQKFAEGRFAQGVASGKAKMTDELVTEIRRLHKQGIHRMQIAEQFGIHKDTVSQIVQRRTWAHLPDPE